MTSQGDSLSKRVERVQNAVRQLPAAAKTLNEATDQLGASVGQLDSILKKFSLGVPSWVPFKKELSEYTEEYYREEVGYAKLGGKWGIAIRTVEGDYREPKRETTEQWLFNDAPRLLRVNAIEKIPDLLETLLEQAAEMTKTIAEKTAEVDAVTIGINSVLEPMSKTKTGKR